MFIIPADTYTILVELYIVFMAILLEKISHLDFVTFKWCFGRKHVEQIARVSCWISRLGDGVYYLIFALVLIWFDVLNSKDFLLCSLLGFCFELPSYLLLKHGIKRQRPHDIITEFAAYLVPSDKFSFPSGHTAAAFVMATMVSFFFPSYMVLAYVVATLIGISRVLLGVHFPTDILAGMILGLSSANAALTLYGVAPF